MKKKKSRYKGKVDVMTNINFWHEFGQTISKGKSGDTVKFESLPFPNRFSPLFIDFQHYGKTSNNTRPTAHYQPYYFIKIDKNNSLKELFNTLKLKEELKPILLMAFASMCIAAANAPKLEWFLKQFNQQKDGVMSLLDMLSDLKSNKKKLCSVHFKYHDVIDNNTGKNHLPFTISGPLPAEFIQGVLSLYEQSPQYSLYKNIKDYGAKGQKQTPTELLKSKNKKVDYYTQGLMLFLLKFHINGVNISDAESYSDPFSQWPELSGKVLKKFKIESLYLFVGRMLELSGLIEFKPSKETAYIKGLTIEDEHLIERIRKRWANKPTIPQFSFGLLIPGPQTKKQL